MFVTRLISGIIVLIVIFATVITGGNVLLLFLGIISIRGQFELYRAVKMEKSLPAFISYLATAGYELLLCFQKQEYVMIFSMIYLIILLACYVILYPKLVTEQITMIFFGFFYVSVLMSYIYQVRCMPSGNYTTWLIFIAAWGSDTFAYCIGVLFGKHKLPSKLSPKKSIEGCIGGVVGAGLLGFLFAAVFRTKIVMIGNPVVAYAIIGCAGSVISQIGDLAASAVKRNHEIKDYGRMIPGHGGILDRFDSILFTAPIVYLLMIVFSN